MKRKERITHEPWDEREWICLCGNIPQEAPFMPCDEKGNQMEPGPGWKGLYVCENCGRIIQSYGLEVVGRRKA